MTDTLLVRQFAFLLLIILCIFGHAFGIQIVDISIMPNRCTMGIISVNISCGFNFIIMEMGELVNMKNKSNK